MLRFKSNFKSHLLAALSLLMVSEVTLAWSFWSTPETMLDRGISCASSIMSSQKGGRLGLELAVETLKGVMEEMPDVKAMKKAVVNCETEIEHLPHSPRVNPEIYIGMLKYSQFNQYPGISKLLSGFAEPKIYCSERGVSGGASALALGAGVSANVSSCRDSFGVRWYGFGIGPQFQSKWLGMSFYSYHNPKHVQEYSAWPAYLSTDYHREYSNSIVTSGLGALALKAAIISGVAVGICHVANIPLESLNVAKYFGEGQNFIVKALQNQNGGHELLSKAMGVSSVVAGGAIVALMTDLRTTNIHGERDKLLGQGFEFSIGGVSANYGKKLNIPFMRWTKDKKYLRDILLSANQDTVEVSLYQ